MNKLHIEIFNNLMALCDNGDDAFFFSDQILESKTFRIFNYRLASYSQWLHDHALECRGITFIVDGDTPVQLVSWPFEKFFNYMENPFTMELNLDNVVEIQNKMDGSLISSMFVDDRIWLKSKGSLFSDQAIAAMAFLNDPNHTVLSVFVREQAKLDRTVIMEYTGPDNRIVVSYGESGLTILGVRNNADGSYVPLTELEIASKYVTAYVDATSSFDTSAFIESFNDTKGIEGYVMLFKDGQRVKIKTDEYLVLHKIKDSINSQRRLFEACVYDTADDIRASFYDDPAAIALVNEMEAKVTDIYNHMVATVEAFFNTNKDLERKEYAIKGQDELIKLHFSLAMSMYLGREVDYKSTMVKHRMDWGIKDDPMENKNDVSISA